MNNLNSIILEGNLTKDPVEAKTPKGTPVCNFSVASNRYYRQEGERQSEVSFVDVEVWARLAETCGEYLKKGRGVRVVGRLKQDRWTDPEGNPRSRLKIVGEHVEFKPQPKTDAADSSKDSTEDDAAPEEDADKAAETEEAVPAY